MIKLQKIEYSIFILIIFKRKIKNLADSLPSDFDCITDLIIPTKVLKVYCVLKRNTFSIDDDIKINLVFETLKELGELYTEIIVVFNTNQIEKVKILSKTNKFHLSDFKDENFNSYIKSHEILLPATYFQGKHVFIKNIYLQSDRM
jgi:hypothetical protein